MVIYCRVCEYNLTKFNSRWWYKVWYGHILYYMSHLVLCVFYIWPIYGSDMEFIYGPCICMNFGYSTGTVQSMLRWSNKCFPSTSWIITSLGDHLDIRYWGKEFDLQFCHFNPFTYAVYSLNNTCNLLYCTGLKLNWRIMHILFWWQDFGCFAISDLS